MSMFVEIAVKSSATSKHVEELNEGINAWVTRISETYPGLAIVDIEIKPLWNSFVMVIVTYRHAAAIQPCDSLREFIGSAE